MRGLVDAADGVVSMYMHPYDATDNHTALENSGPEFRSRLKRLLDAMADGIDFVAASEIPK